MKRTILTAALLAASVAAQAQTCAPPGVPAGSLPPCATSFVPTLSFGDASGADFVTVRPDGVKLHGGATLSFSPLMASGMSLPVGAQAGWVTVRIGDAFYAMPVYQVISPFAKP